MITNPIVNQAINYILEHIREEITVEDVAHHCHFSKFYFGRVFKEETGESVYAFMKRVKLDQSAFRLKVERDRSITEIGMEYGYSSSNYSSAFHQFHNTSPAKWRKEIGSTSVKHPFLNVEEQELESYEECNSHMSIENIPDVFVIYERRIGSYNNLGEEWNTFMDTYQDYITETTMFFERTYDDPSITKGDNCIYDLCMSVPKNCKEEHTYLLSGGKFAVYHFKGYPPQIYIAYQSMFNVWIPAKHLELDDRYGFDLYQEVDCDTGYLEIDLCIPIK